MVRLKFQQLWRNRKREVVLGSAVSLLLLVSLLVNLGSITKKASRTLTGTENLGKELAEKQQELQNAILLERELTAPVRQLASRQNSFWKSSANTQVDFRRKIEQTAKESSLRLKSLGTIQSIKIADGLNSYEITLAVDGQLKDFLGFMAKIEQERPAVYWKNITITPDNIRAPNFLMLNATLKIVVLSAPDIEQRLWGE